MNEINLLKRRILRERMARKEAEAILEKKALELYKANESLRKLNESLEQKVAKRTKELRQSEEKYRGIIEGMELGLLEVDLDNNIVRAYDWFADMTGYSPEELLGQNVKEIFAPNRLYDVDHEEGNKIKRRGQAGVYEMQMRKKDGRLIWVLISDAPIVDAEGKTTGTLGIHYDITARKTLEQELALAKVTAEQAQKAEQQFLANMSHEIRTPMNAVIGMTHLLYETSLNDTQKDYIDALKFSADGLMGLIDNILDLSKIEAGELEFEERSFNLKQMLQGLQRTFQFKVKDKPVSVDMSIDERITNLIIGDPVRLNQILINLLGNASKFTEKGTIGVKVTLKKEVDDKFWIAFHVHDTGIGIPEDKLELIFENFKQADIKVTRKYGGTGLGLTIVKELVEIQGGSIKATSKPTKGSVFEFVLPFINSGVKAADEPKRDKENHLELKAFLKNKNILVVEDNDMNQKLITRILEIWNCTFDLAINGKEAVDFSRQYKYDLVLMDIHMPEMDGVDATKLIRKSTDNPNNEVPIIAMTSAALLDEKNRALNAGMNNYLTKPFSPDLLLDKIGLTLGFYPRNLAEKTELLKNIEVEKPNISFNYLYEFSNGDSLFVKDIVETFIKESPKAFEELNEAFKIKNWENIYKRTHSLKPNFMMLGMKKQQETANQIGKMIKKELYQEDTILNLIKGLETAVEQAYPILQQKLMEI